MEPRWHLLNEGCGKGPINIFFAGAGFEYALAYDVGVRKRLLSWHANSEDEIGEYVAAQQDGREAFGIVDSGAFTVWNKGGEIDVDEYGKKLVELLACFDVAANLDVIPGKQGMAARDITQAMTDDAASRGWENYKTLQVAMTFAGINPFRIMPIYHQGESLDWLKKMVQQGCTYIGISPSNDYPTSQRQHWLDDVFDYLATLPTLPKTHGYAVTSPVLMEQYPWFSVDSASWVLQAGYGAISTPFGIVTLTNRQSSMGRAESMDGRDWTPDMIKRVSDYLEGIGLDIEKVKESHHDRWRANAIFMLNWEKSMQYRRRPKPTGLFE